MTGSAEQSRNILITGGAGFIGSHLCERLVGEGHRVICLDNFFTGCRDNVEFLSNSGRFELVDADVCAPLDFPIDEIYHLACPASPVHYQADPVRTLKTCVDGALRVLELAQRCGARVLLASTSEVYGDPLVHPQSEGYRGNVNPIGPRACYDEGKRCAETLFFDYRRMHGTRIKVARIFNTYGPRMRSDDGRVVSNFIVQLLAGRALTLYGDGSQTRSFCYVDDLVEGLVRLMASDDALTGPVNLGNPEEVTMLELAQRLQEVAGAAATTEFRPLPLDDPQQRRPDIELARRTLGWQPMCSLEEGLQKTLDDFRRRV